MIGPWSFAIVVTGAATAALAKIAATPEAGVIDVNKVRFAPLVPGNIAWDKCDCGAQLAFTIQNDVPTSVYPTDASNAIRLGGCEPPTRFVNVVAVWSRCVPGMDNQGAPPSPGALLASALMFQGAGYGLRTGVQEFLCEEKRQYRISDYRVGTVIYPGPEGNCASAELAFSFSMPD